MINPDPKKYLALPEAFNVLGRERFGAAWTDKELEARDLMPPDEMLAALERAEATIDRIEAGRKQKAEAVRQPTQGAVAPKTIPAVEAPLHESPSSRLETIAQFAGLALDVVIAAADEASYREEYAARQRRDQIESELRGDLYAERRGAVVVNTEDGLVIPIPKNRWLVPNNNLLQTSFRVDFGKGVAGWIEERDGQSVVYCGNVWIERSPATELPTKYDRADVTNSAEPTAVSTPATLTPPVDDGEISVVAQLPEWWPKRSKTQETWIRRWKEFTLRRGRNKHLSNRGIMIVMAKHELNAKRETDAVNTRRELIRKQLRPMIKHGGPPK